MQKLNMVDSMQIDDMVDELKYESWVVPNTTTTVVAAIMPDNFVVALGTSATVSSENFNADIGYDIALNDAKQKATDKLWELKGWELHQQLNN